MSNDTQVAAHMVLVRNHIELVKEHARYDVINRSMAAVESSARQLSEQPGFVMVPVGDMAELREALDICVSLLESAKSNHLPRIIAAYSKADAIVKAATCDCPAKDMPFGRCCKARPLTASPTDPSTEASEPVATIRYERGTPGKENDMPKVVSCNWLPDGVYSVYTTPPPAPVLSDAERGVGACSMCGANVEDQIVKPALLSDAWQPIETAPKDRTLLLGYFNSHGKWRTLRGQWFSQESIEETWEEPEFAGEGWYETPVEIDDTPNCFWTEPTHWQPLPPPPIEQAIGRASRGAK